MSRVVEKEYERLETHAACSVPDCKSRALTGPVLEGGWQYPLCWEHHDVLVVDGLLMDSEEELAEYRAKKREKTFNALEEMGVGYVYVGYYGGSDDGVVEPIWLYSSKPPQGVVFGEEDERMDFPEIDKDLMRMGFSGIDKDLIDELSEPVEEALGGSWYDGPPEVQGYIEWLVPERKVVMNHSYEDWITQDPKEV